jgi:hypothetical protein
VVLLPSCIAHAGSGHLSVATWLVCVLRCVLLWCSGLGAYSGAAGLVDLLLASSEPVLMGALHCNALPWVRIVTSTIAYSQGEQVHIDFEPLHDQGPTWLAGVFC